jgi:death-on-curing family protein
MSEVVYPKIEDIVEINRRVGCTGTFINRSNLDFLLEKVKGAKTITRKAAMLMCDIVRMHPFLDGNKRTAFVTMDLFLKL